MELWNELRAPIWVFGWAIIMYLFHRDATRRRLHKYDLIHKERLHAIEKGIPYPELPPYVGEEEPPAPPSPRPARWYFGLGTVLLMGGGGLLAALILMKEQTWPLGLIPMFVGAGLWLNYWLSRTGQPK
jgi:hypothetical protein